MSTRPIVDPLIGKTVAQHTILAKLGGGGMGVVYQARDAKLGRLVALKFLPPQWSHDDSAKQRFIREAQAASATEHPNICTIHDIETTDDGQLFIVMSYYEGQTLKQRLEAGPLSVDEALQVATQVAEGLVKAHARGIVHRDIKPGNLMLTEDGVRILDFGLAKFADALHLTMVGSTLGTAAYMSPEQARSEEADARSDLWGVGVVLYEMLTGETPFKGIYPEAISYAIRNDPTPPLKAEERGIPERVEQLVLKTLQKDPAERYQTARELARDLRLLQGLTVPFDLRTEPVSVPRADQVPIPKRSHWRRPVLIGAALLVLIGAGISAWLFSPAPRIPVAVSPVINLTGDKELDGYRLALTETLVAELTESATVRVVPYGRLLEILRRFVAGESDVSSRDALQAIASHSAATFIVVPTLVYENNAWRARAEFRSALTATNVAVHETEPIVSSLNKETAFKLIASLAEGTQKYFDDNAPRNRRALNAFRRLGGFQRSPITPRMRSLDASAAFERGINAYEQLEFRAAREAFVRAAEQDPRNPVAFAWWSRAAQILREDSAAQQAADQATKLVSAQTSEADRMFVAAVLAEAQRDFTSARARYRDLASKYSDEPAWLVELAGFEDRHGKVADAIATYRQALALDGRLVRPHLELCKLYNRITEFASAEEQGTASLSGYRALGNRGGEAQALLCRADRLRLGSDDNRNEARVDAENALKIFTDLGSSYNVARGYNYVALAAEVEGQGHPAEAAALWEQSLARARDAGNVVLQPLVLMNLGAIYVRLGSRSRALDYYQQSHDLNEALGNELGAAQTQANVGAILIENAGRREEGLRGVKNALEVFRKVGDTKFEAFGLKVLAAAYRYVGQHAEAERELNRALALIGERNVDRDVAALTIDLARSRLELSDYATAENLLLGAAGSGSGKDSAEARIHLALAHLGLGKFADAQNQLTRASAEVQARGDAGQLPSLHEAMGELALESGLLREARQHFRESAALWTDDLPDPASVQARAYLGLLDALDGEPVRAQSAIQSSLDQARKIGLLSLEARCRVFLAQALISERRFGDALSTLNAVAPDSEKSLGPELQAYLHYWRSRALAGQGGDLTRSDSERNVAKKLLEDLRASLPEPYRSSFTLRPAIRQLIG